MKKATSQHSLRRQTLHLMSGAAVSVMAAQGALAQTDDEIIVSATKREQTLQEVPIAVSVVDGDVIEKAQIIDLIDLQSTVPSLRVTQLQNSSQTNFVIRGFGNGANNPGIESAVGVFIDGVFRSRSASAILDLPTLERVEVLRGPQSTLFGKNVSVGAISISTKKPTFDWEGNFNVTYGNLDAVRFKGTLAGPITDTLAFRVSGSTSNRDGTYTNIVTGDDNINERDRWGARAQLLWEPTETLSFRAIGEYNRIDEICCGAVQLVNSATTQVIGDGLTIPVDVPGVGSLGNIIVPGLNETFTPIQDLDARQVALDTLPQNTLVGRGGSLQADWDLGWAQLTSITAYREQTDFNQTDVDFSGAAIATQPQDQLSQTFTQEVRLAGYNEVGIGSLNWIVGGFFFDEDLAFERDVIFEAQSREFVGILGGLGGIEGALPGVIGNILTGVPGASVQDAFDPSALTGAEAATGASGALVFGIPGLAPALFPELSSGVAPVPVGAGFTPGTGVFGDYTLDNRSYSLFGQFDWEVTERLTLTGGISYVNDRKIAVGNSLLNETTSLINLEASGAPLIAAGAFSDVAAGAFAGVTGAGGSIPTNPLTGAAFTPGDFAFVPTQAGLSQFLGNAFALQAVAPDLFTGIQGGASGAGAALAGDPSVNPLLALSAAQFFQPQFNFPVAGVVPDPANSLIDDGFVVDDSVNYTARIAYDVVDYLNVYFSYATGFKASAVNLSSDSFPPAQATDAAGNLLTDDAGNPVIIGRFANPEDVTTFEIGAKAQFPGGFINVALFDQEVDQFQINAFTGTAFALINAGTQTVRGFEIESAYSPIDSLNFTFGITYLDPEITEFVNAPCNLFFGNPACANGEATFDASGIRPAGVHEISLSTSANYYKELNNGAAINARLEYIYESDVRVIDNGPADITRQVSVFNANVGLELENGFNVNLFGRNLTDDDFLLSAFPTVAQAGSFSGYVSEPRTYGVSVGFKF